MQLFSLILIIHVIGACWFLYTRNKKQKPILYANRPSTFLTFTRWHLIGRWLTSLSSAVFYMRDVTRLRPANYHDCTCFTFLPTKNATRLRSVKYMSCPYKYRSLPNTLLKNTVGVVNSKLKLKVRFIQVRQV